MPAPDSAPAQTAPPMAPAPRRSRRRLAGTAVIALLLVASGTGGAWVAGYRLPLLRDEAGAKPAQAKKPLFATLDPFTVNLQDPRGERFAQIGVTLQFDDPEIDLVIKERLPAVRNEILMLISSKEVGELLSMEGKQELARQIRLRAGRALGVDLPEPAVAADSGASAARRAAAENPIRRVLFSQFLVQ